MEVGWFRVVAVAAVLAACGARTELGNLLLVDGGGSPEASGFDGSLLDAHHPDAASDASALDVVEAFDGDAGAVACGPDASCNANVDYCYTAGGGPPPGFSEEECRALPSGCHACSCVPKQNVCMCTDTAGKITVSCAFP